MAEVLPFPPREPQPPAWLAAFVAVVQAVTGIIKLAMLLAVPILAGYGLAQLF